MEQASTVGSIRQNKAFKQRISYWQAKGFSPEEAHRRASIRNQLSLAPPWDQPAPKASCAQQLTNRKPVAPKTCADENLPGVNRDGQGLPMSITVDPSPFSAGKSWTETCCAEKLLASDNHRTPKSLTAEALHFAVCAIIVLGASSLLIESSAAVFGSSLQGWLKALLLELGILGLSVCHTPSVADFLIARFGALALALLSLVVLHTGVKSSQLQALTAIEASSEDVRNLREERAQLAKVLETLPASHLTRRQEILRQLQLLSERLRGERVHTARGTSAQIVERTHLVESLMRAALMFLNITFAHRAMRQFNPNLAGMMHLGC